MYVQIRTTDVLIFASGAPTREDHWTFWLVVPAEWGWRLISMNGLCVSRNEFTMI